MISFPRLFYLTDNQLELLECAYQRRCRGVTQQKGGNGANQLRDTNATEEEEVVADSDVTLVSE